MLAIDKNFSGRLSHDIADYPEGLVLVIDKPWRWTSADVIRKVKYAACRHFAKKNLKVGHAGTLDPLASGVLIVCIGAACKQAQTIQATSKQYLAGMCFGAVTASYDREKPVEAYGRDRTRLEADDVKAALDTMLGPQEQVAPLFSAKQVDGVRAYNLARKMYGKKDTGLDSAAASLLNVGHIEINALSLEGFTLTDESINSCIANRTSPDNGGTPSGRQGASNRINVAEVPSGLQLASIRIDCSKGTYIRAIARDLGEKLGTGAFLTSLRRTRCGQFSADDALDMESVLRLLVL